MFPKSSRFILYMLKESKTIEIKESYQYAISWITKQRHIDIESGAKIPEYWITDGTRLNISRPSGTYMRHQIELSLVRINACRLFSAKLISEPITTYRQVDPYEETPVKFREFFSLMKMQ